MMPQQSQQSPMDINHYQDMMLNLVYNATSIVTMPVEMALRLQYGSRYFPPAIQCLSFLMMIILPVLGAMWEGFSGLIPFMRVSASMGLFDMGTFSKLFFLGSFVHGLRVWRRMIHMEREQHSAYEGPPLPIFRIVPGSFWLIRIVYEPAFVFVLSIVLENFFILQPGAAHFLMFSAVMLAMKQYVAWYMQWQFLRELMDMRNAGPIIAKIVDNSATEDELATIHLASIPKDIPEDMRRETATHIARAFTGTSEFEVKQ
jgi:hypothetical protein